MKQEVVVKSKRKFVVVTDPHIKHDTSYNVFNEGMLMDGGDTRYGHKSNIFVKDRNMELYKGNCWPGLSVWVDFFNEEGRKFWASLYDFSNF